MGIRWTIMILGLVCVPQWVSENWAVNPASKDDKLGVTFPWPAVWSPNPGIPWDLYLIHVWSQTMLGMDWSCLECIMLPCFSGTLQRDVLRGTLAQETTGRTYVSLSCRVAMSGKKHWWVAWNWTKTLRAGGYWWFSIRYSSFGKVCI